MTSGYRILSSEFALPAIDLDAEEAAVVGVAARVWRREHGRGDKERHRQAAGGGRGTGCLAACFPGAIRSGIGAGL